LNDLLSLIDDRYELLEVIASGGMATVWRARDIRLDRTVAVKRPHPSAPDDATALHRMSREARAAASLSHPNIVTVYDFGVDEDGGYLVMELVEGPSLQEAMDQLGGVDVIDVAVGIAEGLAAIHSAGIIHRDVKPANVILSDHGPLLTDFGIALNPTTADDVTADGIVVATPSYAAPEVMAGEAPTSRSDVYSLAVVVREMLEASGTSPSPDVRRVLESAMAEAPELRPDARALGAALMGATPTVPLAPLESTAIPSVGGIDSTLVLESPPPPAVAAESGVQTRSGTRRLATAFLVLVLVVLLVVAVWALGTGDSPEPVAAPTTTTTAVTTSQTSASTTSEQSTPVDAPTDPVQESRDRIEEILLQPPRSDMSPRDVEKAMNDIDKAIVEATEGDPEKAVDMFEKVAETLAKKLDDGFDEVIDELQLITDALGLDVEMPREED